MGTHLALKADTCQVGNALEEDENRHKQPVGKSAAYAQAC